MIYLILVATDDAGRQTTAIEACGTEAAATRIELRGYVRCYYARYREAWREKDKQAVQELRRATVEAVIAASRARIVGRLPGKVYPPFETGL